MKIPTHFKLFGKTITVEYSEDMAYLTDRVGCAKHRQNKIVLQRSTPQVPLPKESVEENFIHELVHFVLDHVENETFEPRLCEREWLVELVANLLHQALTTMVFGDDESR